MNEMKTNSDENPDKKNQQAAENHDGQPSDPGNTGSEEQPASPLSVGGTAVGSNPAEPAQPGGADEVHALSEAAQEVRSAMEKVKKEMGKVIVGQSENIDYLLSALLTRGHVLIEGVPGIAKTLTSRMLAKCLRVPFSRIQFTPDLMPTDIIGTSIFDMKRSEFSFKQGPIFSQVVLIDEINRSPAKTQAALMEVMEEEQVTVDGRTYQMAQPFFVVATQNPIEQEGTYTLPEAQLDRFMFKLHADYPAEEEELAMLQRFREDFYGKAENEVMGVLNSEDILRYRAMVERVFIKDELLGYIARIVAMTRNNSDLYLGASPRASLSLLRASKALALIAGRNFVSPDDIKRACYPVLNHRLILSYDREIEGVAIAEVIESIVNKVEVPR